jgi:hypothetical protein
MRNLPAVIEILPAERIDLRGVRRALTACRQQTERSSRCELPIDADCVIQNVGSVANPFGRPWILGRLEGFSRYEMTMSIRPFESVIWGFVRNGAM